MTGIKSRIANVIIAMFILSSPACGLDLPTAKVTLKVVDENGIPISGAKATIGFNTVKKDKIFSGTTNQEGLFSASTDTTGRIGYEVKIDGWYTSEGEYRYPSNKHEAGKWQPWDPEIKVVMRRIEKPVPMYARDLKMSFPNVEIPVIGKEAGFDLIEYDWVTPYGHGQKSDLIFKLQRSFNNDNDFDVTLTITFTNKFDGIQVIKDDRKGGSMFKLPRYASEDGYQNRLTRFIRSKGVGNIEDDSQKDNNYLFRVRSEVKDGKLVRAMYGKIQGEIEFEPRGRKTAVLLFKYFLNPDYTRNLEFGENLFKNLKSTEQVREDN